MAGAFQPNAFQNDAFQTEAGPSFTADAIIQKTQSASFTVDAIIVSFLGSFTADARLLRHVESVFYEDVVVDLGPSAYWRLGESSGTEAAAVVGPAGVYSGSHTKGQTGAIINDADTAVLFSGGRITMPDDAAVDLGATFSIVAWAKRNATGTDDRIVYKSNSAYSLLILSNNTVRLDQPFVGSAVNTSTTITDTDWHLVVATWGATAAERQIYIDSVAQPATVINRTFVDNAADFVIGTDADFGGGQFSGSIDEVALFQRVLTQQEINQLYRSGIDGLRPLTADAVIEAHTRVQHDRGTSHTGVDRDIHHVLTFAIERYVRGESLQAVLYDLNDRITALERRVALRYGAFTAQAVIAP